MDDRPVPITLLPVCLNLPGRHRQCFARLVLNESFNFGFLAAIDCTSKHRVSAGISIIQFQPTQFVLLTAAKSNCKWSLQCKVLSRATKGAICASRDKLNPSLPLCRPTPGWDVPVPRSSPPRPASRSRRPVNAWWAWAAAQTCGFWPRDVRSCPWAQGWRSCRQVARQLTGGGRFYTISRAADQKNRSALFEVCGFSRRSSLNAAWADARAVLSYFVTRSFLNRQRRV